MMVKFPEVGQNFPKLEETAPLACKKSLENYEKYGTVHIFYLENLINLYILD